MGFTARLDTSVLTAYGPNTLMKSQQHNNGLPAGWEVRMSSSRGIPYYFSPTSTTSSWEPPEGTDKDALSRFMAENFSSAAPKSASGSGEGKIRTAHLLIKHSGSRRPSSWREAEITRSKDEAIEKLKGFEKRIRDGETTLGELARTESDCPSARKGGDLGFFGRGDMQKPFEEAAFALQPGQMSSVVDTDSGVHLIESLRPENNGLCRY